MSQKSGLTPGVPWAPTEPIRITTGPVTTVDMHAVRAAIEICAR